MKKCLIIELWWLGDATLMTSIVQGLEADGWAVTVLGKTQSRLLLQEDYPNVKWIEFNAPWTAFHGKYLLWRWPWVELARILREVRHADFDAAVSIRLDPRDHFLFWLARVPRRIGIRTPLSLGFLNQPLPPPPPDHHRVEDWWNAQQRVSPEASKLFPPRLGAPAELREKYRQLFARDGRPVIALHCGARNIVRRWPEAYFRELITGLRARFDFQFLLYPDQDDYGRGLIDLADHVFTGLTLPELKASLAHAQAFIGNDSGPGHVADALDVPVITIFGPGDPLKMRPFSPHNLVVMRDVCPYHPCSDYCRYDEPYCLTQVPPSTALREIGRFLSNLAAFDPQKTESSAVWP